MAEFKIIQMYNSTGDAIFPKTKAQVVDYIPENGTATTVAAELASLRKDLTTAAAGGITSIKVGETFHTAADNSTAVDLTTAINGLIASNIHMNVEVVTELPVSATEKDLGKIILIADDKSAAGTYIEYIAVKTSDDPVTYAWEQIGTTAVDLTGYATVGALNAVDKKADDNAAAIKAINESAVMTSGITAELVGKITVNESAIGTINSSAVMTSGITADKVAKYEGYEATINGKANAADVYTKTDAEAMAEGKASAAIEALDLPNTYAAKSATEQHIANGDIHVTTDDKNRWDNKQDAITNADNIVFKDADGYLIDAAGAKLTNIIYFEEEVTA